MHSGLSGKAVTFDMTNGLILGAGATTTIELIVSNKTNSNVTALSFSSKVTLNSPSYLKNFVLFPSITKVECAETKLIKNTVGLSLNATEVNDKLTTILNASSQDFNANYKMGWPLANLNPNFGMIGGLLKNSTMSTQVTDGYMMLGFEMQADLPTAIAPEQELMFL